MIYILTFALSLLFIKLSMIISKKNKKLSIVVGGIGIIIPCLLAAFRDYTIGTDVEVYVHPLFIAAKRYSTFTTFYNSITSVQDILYLLVTYICAHVSEDIGLLFFFNELLVILPIYIALRKRFKSSNCVLLGMSLFYLFFYNQSYNMARQSIAIAFIILGLAFLDENKNKKFFACFLIACLFHNTAKIFIVIFIIYKILESNKIDKKIKFIIEFIILIGCIGSLFFLPQVVNIIQRLNFINEAKTEVYTSKYLRSSVDVSYIHSVLYLYVLLIILIYRKKIKENEENSKYYIFSTFLSFIILQLGTVIAYAERVGYYIFYPLVITMVPYIIYSKQKSVGLKVNRNNFIFFTMTLIIFATYWIIWICIIKYNATYPYLLRQM